MNLLAHVIDILAEDSKISDLTDIETHFQQTKIRIFTEYDQVIIVNFYNKPAIYEGIQSNIFDYLFTTKGVGKETG